MKKHGVVSDHRGTGCCTGQRASSRQGQERDAGRLLTGRVVNNAEAALPDSVVYLANTRTRAVKTFIVGKDGMYRFPALSLNVDYEVYAQYKDSKSDTKTVSQFDTRPTVNINLKIDTK